MIGEYIQMDDIKFHTEIFDDFELLINNCCKLTNNQIIKLMGKLSEELDRRTNSTEGLGISVVETIMTNDKR